MPPEGPEHSAFVNWAEERGVKIYKVAPAKFEGRGIGIAATQRIKVCSRNFSNITTDKADYPRQSGEVLVKVPTAALLTVDTIPPASKAKFEGITVHGLLASFLTFGDESLFNRYAPWEAVWPSPQDFNEIMPLLWPKRITGYDEGYYPPTEADKAATRIGPYYSLRPLPPALSGVWTSFYQIECDKRAEKGESQGLLPKQERKLRQDFERVFSAIPDANFQKYTYYWLIVNTRSFYYIPPGGEVPRNRDDAMALCPFVDYFNHADTGCPVTFDDYGFMVRSDTDYEPGEELYVCYGNHSNDFLLTEYGFILAENRWDTIFLDDIILEDLNWQVKRTMERHNYLGNYAVTKDGPCFRTEVVANYKFLSPKDWQKFIDGNLVRNIVLIDRSERWATTLMARWVAQYKKEADCALEQWGKIGKDDCEEHVKETLRQRWVQIVEICKSAIDQLGLVYPDEEWETIRGSLAGGW